MAGIRLKSQTCSDKASSLQTIKVLPRWKGAGDYLSAAPHPGLAERRPLNFDERASDKLPRIKAPQLPFVNRSGVHRSGVTASMKAGSTPCLSRSSSTSVRGLGDRRPSISLLSLAKPLLVTAVAGWSSFVAVEWVQSESSKDVVSVKTTEVSGAA